MSGVQIAYTPLGGGLDLESSALTVKPGRLVDCLNFEQAFGVQGYRRIFGYERFDGRPEPHLATYATQPFKNGTVAFVVGDIAQGTTASGEVAQVVLQSGAWGAGTAAGFLVLVNVTSAWAVNEAIKVGGVTRAAAGEITQLSDITSPQHYTYLRLARNTVRAKILKVPGEGPVLGVAVFKGDIYAVRNIVGSTSATFWRTSAAGWVSVKTGMAAGGRYRFEVANFSGASTTLALFGVSGKGRFFKYDGTTFTYAAPIYGSEATSTTSNTVGAGAKSFAIPQSARSWTAGQVLQVTQGSNNANRMTGTVTSYVHPNVTLNITSFTGAGTFTDWEIGAADYSDKPYDLIAHKDHMWFAYPLGQLQTSNLGDPMVATTTAALFGLGDEITGFASLKGSMLSVFCNNKITMITGTSAVNFATEPYSTTKGAKFGTVMESGGNAIFLDKRGLQSLQSTQQFGDFAPSEFSKNVAEMLVASVGLVVGARITRESYQYRLYCSDGKVFNFGLMTAASIIRPDDVSITSQEYPHIPSCFGNGDLKDGTEGIFFGTSDGYVMRESIGTSFDGDEIESVFRLPFDHYKSPSNNKRFHKLMLELDSKDSLAIKFLQIFDYDDGEFDASILQNANSTASGGSYNAANWNEFIYSTPTVSRAEVNVDGVARNMGLIMSFSSDVVEPFIMQGVLTHYSVRGLRR